MRGIMKTKDLHIMIDLETMGHGPNSAIVSIGAYHFDEYTGEIYGTFHKGISLDSCLEKGMTVSESTIFWWLQQSEEARKSLINLPKQDISTVLFDFNMWLNNIKYRNSSLSFNIPVNIGEIEGVLFPWGNGASFDISILENAYNACKLKIPWEYNSILDVRTIHKLTKDYVDKGSNIGTSHNALDDAIYQAKYVSKKWKMIQDALEVYPITFSAFDIDNSGYLE